jgi:hypothetical protein
MSKSFAYEAFENLKETLSIKDVNQNYELEKIINKNFILSFYTIWETYAKKKVYDTYIDYEYLLHTEDFIKRYLRKSFGKQYLSAIFLKDIQDTKVKKEILCQTNNLNWNEFLDMVFVIGFDKDKIESLINESQALSNIVVILKNMGVMPLQDNIGSTTLDGIKGYLALIIKLRNTISHTYKMELDEKLSNKQMILMVDLFKCLIGVIENYFEIEVARIFLEVNIGTNPIQVNKVIKGCNGSGTQNAILEIQIDDESIDLGKKEWVIKSSTNKGYCKIKDIRVGNVKLKKIPYKKTCTISVLSNIKIRQSVSANYQLSSSVFKRNQGLNIISYSNQ